jgi:hypothetical protein
MTLTLEQRRAYALDLINNPLLGDILEEMKSDVFKGWKRPDGDTAAREQAWTKYRAIEGLISAIESALRKANEALGVENEDEDESL